MLKHTRLLTILIFFSASLQMVAQDMVTDRPDQTESASIVPKFRAQLESGFDFKDPNALSGIKNVQSIQSLLRFGVASNMELRLGFANETSTLLDDPKNSVSNVLNPGIKYRILNGEGIIPDVAVLGSFILPINKVDNELAFWSPEIRLAAQSDLLDFLSIGANFALFWDSDAYDTQKFYSVVLGLDVIPNTGLFFEFFGEEYKTLGSEGYLNGGFTYNILNNLQLDGYIGYGLNENSDSMFWGVGITVRLPK